MTERERLFVEYWEAHRLREKTLLYQILTGLPMGLLFGIPIILVLLSGRFWYKRADMVANSEMSSVILVIAILLIAVFVAVIYKRHQWEMKEQQYKEIKARNKTNS
jgi:hypothetical protein